MLELAVREKACVVAIAETELHALSDALSELLIEALEQPVTVLLCDAEAQIVGEAACVVAMEEGLGELLEKVLNELLELELAQPVTVVL